MNLAKCIFGIVVGNFLGFLVHHQGIKVDRNKDKAILEAIPLWNKMELQSLIGKIKFLKRFITNFARKIKAFSPLLRLKNSEEIIWGEEQQKAFDHIKQALTKPPILTSPVPR